MGRLQGKTNMTGSRLLAMIFMVIALMGVMMVMSSPDEPDTAGITAEQTSVTELTPPAERPGSVSLVGYLWKVVLVTALVIGLFWLLAGFFRKRMMPQTGSTTQFHVLGREHLNPRNTLMMVRVEDRKFLLGVSENAVRLISEFEMDSEELNSDPAEDSKNSFSGILQQVKDRISPSGDRS